MRGATAPRATVALQISSGARHVARRRGRVATIHNHGAAAHAYMAPLAYTLFVFSGFEVYQHSTRRLKERTRQSSFAADCQRRRCIRHSQRNSSGAHGFSMRGMQNCASTVAVCHGQTRRLRARKIRLRWRERGPAVIASPWPATVYSSRSHSTRSSRAAPVAAHKSTSSRPSL